MKKCLRWIRPWLSGTGSMFSLCVVAYGAACLAAGEAAVPLGMLASLLLASGAGTLLQLLFFSPRPFRRMGYSLRTLCFGLAYLPCLAGLALAFSWFPREEAGAWLVFVGIFLVILAAVALAYAVAFRIKGAKYNGLLGQYKKNLEK